MITLSAVFHAKSGREADLKAALCAMIPEARKEPGTLEYTVHQAKEDPGMFFFYEQFRDQAALDIHMAAPYLKALLDRVPELCASAPVVTFYDRLSSIRD
ncbi:putative quinol monooxygenase [Uliginosibacterium flavum]|uniref:Quinol monooxygenase n=1 Tax=Uliginosibacterium flavum TaxID=1396831 RepID=A0ABV2TQG5_9RHOO